MKKQNNNDPEQLKFENELKKMEIALKTGAQFHSDENSAVPPEVERQFLRNLVRFEAAWNSGKTTTIYKSIGCPELKEPETLTEREVTHELKQIMELMLEHGISVDSICNIDDRTLYTFIKEELMDYETQDMKMPGFMTCFVYEEFHPNHEYDIKTIIGDVTRNILRKSENEFGNIELMYIDNLLQLQLFTKAFEEFTIHHFNVNMVKITDEKANATFEIKFTGFVEGSRAKIVFHGNGSVNLEFFDDCWWIKKLELPD